MALKKGSCKQDQIAHGFRPHASATEFLSGVLEFDFGQVSEASPGTYVKCWCSGVSRTSSCDTGVDFAAPAGELHLLCPTGLYFVEGKCICAPGLFMDIDETCVTCTPMHFCDGLALHACPANSGTEQDGRTSETDCKCGPGYGTIAGSGSSCSPGTFKPGFVNTVRQEAASGRRKRWGCGK